MRAVIQLLFLLFYVGSSYVTTQHRIFSVIHGLRHSKSRDDSAAFENCKQRVGYTHFREAKKVSLDLHFGIDAKPDVQRLISSRHFTPQRISLQDQHDGEASHPRAPPIVQTQSAH
jgi:hypothetical protein